MINVTLIIFFQLLLLYNFSMFSYTSYVYVPQMEQWKIIFLTSTANTFMFLLPQMLHINDAVPIILFLTCYTSEYKLIYKKDTLQCYMAALIFMTALYAWGLIAVGLISMTTNVSIFNSKTEEDIRLITSVITMIPAILQTIALKQLCTKEQIDVLLSHKKSLVLSCRILTIIFIYGVLIANIKQHSYIDPFKISLLNTKIGIIMLVGLGIAIVFGYVFAKLNLEVEQFNKYSTLAREEQDRINELSKTAHKDSFTGLYLREVGMERINFYKQHKILFFVIFIDMDGLKFVNDTFGHNEGDFYILEVAKMLQVSYEGSMVIRLGGDEFLVVGTSQEVYTPTRNTLAAYTEITNLSSKYEKPYDTSISYGIVNIDETLKFDTDAIVALADERMYEFKKGKKKERVVKKIVK
ncbi:MAG: hypothetical protein BEN18_06455 [Epulopiscium sp. Nuni2H_MBin001]|nr:MAG: hypothetical protein BEN18_06455 [Epulopiscium sp. Nuni2H_MBin001]